ncbi:Pentatricopeptide repeat-containing protein [Porphyridium purpureum]|uniref:Pentatricopeptide repeat-containing protein n=1 Tax=Porphyridium purpureum TaxID=35688 RepID=A0A5J4YX80_PORPP|nr:Pentatricopeptide repeat-containing protein [Porphyridium purpureum]|eukprot:POR2803..scf209_3
MIVGHLLSGSAFLPVPGSVIKLENANVTNKREGYGAIAAPKGLRSRVQPQPQPQQQADAAAQAAPSLAHELFWGSGSTAAHLAPVVVSASAHRTALEATPMADEQRVPAGGLQLLDSTPWRSSLFDGAHPGLATPRLAVHDSAFSSARGAGSGNLSASTYFQSPQRNYHLPKMMNSPVASGPSHRTRPEEMLTVRLGEATIQPSQTTPMLYNKSTLPDASGETEHSASSYASESLPAPASNATSAHVPKATQRRLAARLESALRERRVADACALLHEYGSMRVFSTRHYNAVLDALCKGQKVAEAERLFSSLSSPDVASYSIMISMYAKLGRANEAELLFAVMRNSGGKVQPNAFTYSAMIEAMGRIGRIGRAQEIFDEMVRESELGMASNVVACNAMLKVFVKGGQFDAAMRLADQMEAHGVRADVVTYGTLIDACSKAHDVERAFAFFDRMVLENVRPNRVCYASLIDACGKCKQIDRAFEVFEQMKRDGISPDLFTFNALIDSCGRSRMVERAFAAYEEIGRHNLKPDRVTFNALITCCARARALSSAFKVLDDMTRLARIRPDRHTFNSLIDACGKSERLDLAENVYSKMCALNVRPCVVTFNALIDACGRARAPERAFYFLQEMAAHGVEPDTYTLNTMVAVLCRSGMFDRAVSVLRVMRERADEVSYNTLIDFLAKAGDGWEQTAASLMLEMQTRNLSASRSAIASLSTALGVSLEESRPSGTGGRSGIVCVCMTGSLILRVAVSILHVRPNNFVCCPGFCCMSKKNTKQKNKL